MTSACQRLLAHRTWFRIVQPHQPALHRSVAAAEAATSTGLHPHHHHQQQQQIQVAFFSSYYSSKAAPTTWQQAAIRVKNTDHEKDNPYLDLIRDTHDPSMHLKTIEDELKGTIGKALGKQGEKILYYIQLMQQTNEEYQRLANTCPKAASNQKAREYNDYRKQAIQARWELLVHRQAAGFIVNNHKTVYEHYQIPDALPVDEEVVDDDNETAKDNSMAPADNKKNASKPTKFFGDQLDWWQRVGRWR